jgi:hypothetical protein
MVELTQKYKKLIQDRYSKLEKDLNLAITDPLIYKLLLPQTIQGNIAEGHSNFKGEAIPEIEMEDICSALGFNPIEIREQRTQLCYESFECVDAIFNGTRNKLVNKKGEPLFRVEFFKDYQLEIDKDLFKAGVKIGRMDSAYWRKRTVQHYPTTLEGEAYDNGRGAEHLVNKVMLKDIGLTPLALARKAHGNEQANNPNIENMFVRYNEGLGICDDLAICTVRALHGESGARLGLAIDAMDTYGKWITSAVNGGLDEFFAEYIVQKWQEKYNEKLVSDEECLELIYLASKSNIKISPFSSSHRRFIQKESKNANYTFLEHMKFIETGQGIPNIKLGFHRTPSKQFYENLRQRFDAYKIGHLIPPEKEKIPRSQKENKKIKTRTRKKTKKSIHISNRQNHDSHVKLIAQNPELIGLKKIIGQSKTEKYFFNGIDKKRQSIVAGEADLFFQTSEGPVVVEYKGRDHPNNRTKAKRELLNALTYLNLPVNKTKLLYVFGPDFQTVELVQERENFHKSNHNNPYKKN